eukprot:Clim_evm69s152 gene=Clim_evmTU69s152
MQRSTENLSWSRDGTFVFIPDKHKFEREVLQQLFKQTKIKSFIRQLNMYGFHKFSASELLTVLREGSQVSHAVPPGCELADVVERCIAFSHPYFQRGKVDLVNKMKRRRGMEKRVKGDNICHSRYLGYYSGDTDLRATMEAEKTKIVNTRMSMPNLSQAGQIPSNFDPKALASGSFNHWHHDPNINRQGQLPTPLTRNTVPPMDPDLLAEYQRLQLQQQALRTAHLATDFSWSIPQHQSQLTFFNKMNPSQEDIGFKLSFSNDVKNMNDGVQNNQHEDMKSNLLYPSQQLFPNSSFDMNSFDSLGNINMMNRKQQPTIGQGADHGKETTGDQDSKWSIELD